VRRQLIVDPRGEPRLLLATPTPRVRAGQCLDDFLPVYRWHWKAKLPERRGELLVVLARGTMNSCLVEFLSDGFRAITSRNALRRAHPR
jgi:hypothetical protein